MNALAKELNDILKGSVIERLLSDFGKRMYFPKGIVAQAAEAKAQAKRHNATIGVSYSHGEPMLLSAVHEAMPTLTATEAVSYAPTAGIEALRARWKLDMKKKNPSLDEGAISLPVVVPGLTAGLSLSVDLFMNPGDVMVLPDLHWDNYPLIIGDRKGACITTYPFFDAQGRYNVAGLAAALKKSAKDGVVRTILNFPNNPTGFTPSATEADSIIEAMRSVAESGINVLAIVDDAYFGLFYDDACLKESLFARLSRAHPNLLAVKADGSTKEDFVWGFRLGFLTFGCAGATQAHYDALVKKLMGAIRSSVSCCNTPGQYISLKSLDDPRSPTEKVSYFEELKGRYLEVKHVLGAIKLPSTIEVLPFNSGYFMTLRVKGLSAETLRRKLLERGVGVIAFGDEHIRVAFASVERSEIEDLYSTIAETAESLRAGH